MPWWTWVSIGVFAFSAVAGAAAAVVLVLRAVRTFRAFAGATGTTLERLTKATEELARKSEALSGQGGDLDDGVTRLRESLAKLSTLAWALRDALGLVERLRAAVPGK